MRTLLPIASIAAALIAAPAAAQDTPFVGEYAIAEGPDAGGGLLIRGDGRFQYYFVAGAFDERAEGRWEMRGAMICLTTDPKPVPPAMNTRPLIKTEGKMPTLFGTLPNAARLAGVALVIGLASAAPSAAYPQHDARQT